VLLGSGQRQELVPEQRRGGEFLALERLVSGYGVTRRTDPRTGNVTLQRGAAEVVVYPGKSLASVNGDLRLLSGRVEVDRGRVLVPVDAAPLLLEPLLGIPVRWHPGPRVLAVGDVDAPRIDVATEVFADRVRVVLRASERVPFRLGRAEGQVTVSVGADLVDVEFQQQRFTGGIVDRVQYLGGRGHVFSIFLGPRFKELTTSDSDPQAFVLELAADPLPLRGDAGSARAPDASGGGDPETPVVVIDPGHGGENVGAAGPEGTLEKVITLQIARKLRASVVGNLGYRVFLTRDGDADLALDDRAPIANNYKADLFVSIHANGFPQEGASGSEVYFLSYQATDDESRRVALAEGGALGDRALSEVSPLSMILWDMAQAEHLEESSRLASRIQEELAAVTGSEGRGIKQAPFRVLVGAAMPAVLVEVAFISNPDEEKLLNSSEYQWRIASALMRGIARFVVQRQQRLGASAGR